MAVILETSLGDITIDLFTEERPICCKNFLKLCKVKYYNFSLFHSVQRNLVAQTGDPTGTGRGGESINGIMYGDQARFFDMELVPRMKHRNTGTVSMVNNGGNMHGSQFFITLGENLDYLDGKHTVFGEVGEGMDVLMKINEAYCDEEHRPYKDIRIYHTIILDDPYDDPAGLEVPDKSPEPTKEQLNSGRIGAEEAIDDFEGKTEEEVKEIMEEREAKVNAEMLEVVGDIPDADIKPPENVLFVCKLNPVTSEDDLEIIFSRFGPIESCEVIKDQKTGESLQYAFVEFEKEEDCERAYFKMDNVLIDDRRIHVDFSQSVAKVKWKGKGKGVVTFDDNKIGEERPKFKLKDKGQPKNDKYDLVLEDTMEKSQKKSKKKKHKHKEGRYRSDSEEESVKKKHKHKEDRHGSDSEEERVKKKHKHKEDRHGSDSEEERVKKKHKHKEDQHGSDSEEERKKQKKHKKHKNKSRSRSKSPVADRHKRNAHSRDGSPKRYTDRSPDRYRDRSPDRYKDRAPNRYKDRSPDRYRDRSQDKHRDRSPDKYRDRHRDSHRGHGTGRDRARDYRR